MAGIPSIIKSHLHAATEPQFTISKIYIESGAPIIFEITIAVEKRAIDRARYR